MSKKVDDEEIVTSNNNPNALYGIIIVLLLIIAVGGFFLGMKLGDNGQQAVNTVATGESGIAENISITIYDDKRCSDCQVDNIIESLKQLPVLATAQFTIKDFSDDGVEEFLIDNQIDLLPAAIFSTNAVGPTLAEQLLKLSDTAHFLRLAGSEQLPGFDPFEKRSENGFKVIDEATLTEVQSNAYLKGPAEAPITWVEYTDINCHYCQKMEQDGTAETVLAKFPSELNKTSSNYIGVGGAASQIAAEVLECAGSLGGAEVYNTMLSEALESGNSSLDNMLKSATDKGIDADALQSCYDNGEMKDLVASKFALGAEKFGITGTPGNVLINNETGEYTIVSGAYPADEFISQINGLLGK